MRALLCAGMEAGKLRVNTELFATQDASLFVLQQRYGLRSADGQRRCAARLADPALTVPGAIPRSPAVASREEPYGQRLAAWIRESRFARVLLLSSLPADLRKDQHLSAGGPQLSVGLCASSSEGRKKAEALGWRCVSLTDGSPAPLSSMAMGAMHATHCLFSPAALPEMLRTITLARTA